MIEDRTTATHDPVRTVVHCCWDAGRGPLAAALFWGGSLVVVGLALLLVEAGALPDSTHNVLWPSFLIALGLWILTSPDGVGSDTRNDR